MIGKRKNGQRKQVGELRSITKRKGDIKGKEKMR